MNERVERAQLVPPAALPGTQGTRSSAAAPGRPVFCQAFRRRISSASTHSARFSFTFWSIPFTARQRVVARLAMVAALQSALTRFSRARG